MVQQKLNSIIIVKVKVIVLLSLNQNMGKDLVDFEYYHLKENFMPTKKIRKLLFFLWIISLKEKQFMKEFKFMIMNFYVAFILL